MEKTFGLIIAHRHFGLEVNEHLVAYGNTSSPWKALPKDDSTIKATAWRLAPTGEVQPYEFEFTISEEEILDPNNEEQAAFVKQLVKLLNEKNVDGLFGLCKYPGDDFDGRLEITQGRVNINFATGDVSPLTQR
jgi:hypothetical protein